MTSESNEPTSTTSFERISARDASYEFVRLMLNISCVA